MFFHTQATARMRCLTECCATDNGRFVKGLDFVETTHAPSLQKTCALECCPMCDATTRPILEDPKCQLLLPPEQDMVLKRPGSPSTWSPCMWLMKMPLSF